MKQRIANALIRYLEDGFPLRPAGIVAELDDIARDSSELHLKFVVVEFRGVEPDIALPLAEIIRPVVECCDLTHDYFPSNFATRFSLYALSPSAASALAKACASSSRSKASPSHWLPCSPVWMARLIN